MMKSPPPTSTSSSSSLAGTSSRSRTRSFSIRKKKKKSRESKDFRDPEQEARRHVDGLSESDVLAMIDERYFEECGTFDDVLYVIEHVLDERRWAQRQQQRRQQEEGEHRNNATSTANINDKKRSSSSPPPLSVTEEGEHCATNEEPSYDRHDDDETYTPLQKLSDEFFWRQIYLHEKAVGIMNKRLSSTVMDNYNSFVSGMAKVQEISLDLTSTLITCRSGRKRLASAKRNLVSGGLSVLAKHRKRSHLRSLAHHLDRISQVVRMGQDVKSLLEEDRFSEAVEMNMRRTQLMDELNQFDCIKSMQHSGQSTMDMIESKLDEALRFVCSNFDPVKYESMLVACGMLNDVHITGKISQFYTSTVNDFVNKIVMSFPLNRPKSQTTVEQLLKMKLGELASHLKDEEILTCLLQLFSVLADVMHNYHRMLLWHRDRTSIPDATGEGTIDIGKIRDFVERFRKTLWDLAVNKIAMLMGACKMSSSLSLDEFLQIFHAVSMMCELGEEFSDSRSYKLQGALKHMSKRYFMQFHKEVLVKLKFMLENESWQPLDSFNMDDIREILAPLSREIKSYSSIYGEYAAKVRSFLHDSSADGNPFKAASQSGRFSIKPNDSVPNGEYQKSYDVNDDENSDHEYIENGDDDDDDDDDDIGERSNNDDFGETKLMQFDRLVAASMSDGDEKKHSSGQNITGRKASRRRRKGPVFTNSSVTVVRRMGVYLQAMEVLQPISVDVFFALSTLFKFYLYTVHSHFARTVSMGSDALYPERDPNVPDRLRATFDQIRRSLNKCVEAASSATLGASNHQSDDELSNSSKKSFFFELANLSGMVDITSAPHYGLVERCIAAESTFSLLDILQKSSTKLRALLPKPKVHYADHFVKSMEESTDDVRRCIYVRTVHMITNMESIPMQVEKCKWVVQSAALQQSDYVASLLGDFNKLSAVLEQQGHRLPQETIEYLWDIAIHDAMAMLTEGYARVKKCNNEGRAQMQLDLTSFVDGLQRIANIRPLPHTERVRGYIQAYYYPPEDIRGWIEENAHQYTSKQLANLVNVCPGASKMGKKQRNEILQLIEELEKNQRTLPTALPFGTASTGLVGRPSIDKMMRSEVSSSITDSGSSSSNNRNPSIDRDTALQGNSSNTSPSSGTSSSSASAAASPASATVTNTTATAAAAAAVPSTFGAFAGKIRQNVLSFRRGRSSTATANAKSKPPLQEQKKQTGSTDNEERDKPAV